MYLVDTNAISAGAPSQALATAPLVRWMDANSDRLCLSVITIMKVEDGIAKARRQGATKKAALLTEWFALLLHLSDDRILPFNGKAARVAGGLSDRERSAGQAPGFKDLTIAATAQAHGLIILTRNLRHFASLGVAAHDPFGRLPE
jgi:predicted nucleic acid-binding protein